MYSTVQYSTVDDVQHLVHGAGTSVPRMAAALSSLPSAAATPKQASGGFSVGTSQGQPQTALRLSSKEWKGAAPAAAAAKLDEATHVTGDAGESPAAQGNPGGENQDAPQASEASAGTKRRREELQEVCSPTERYIPYYAISHVLILAPQVITHAPVA